MHLHHVRLGTGKPLLLVHGLGASWQSWSTVVDRLAAEREVVAVDLPGFGETPPLVGKVSVATLADALVGFLEAEDLRSIDLVGSSMGARLVLELARRGVGGATVALDPGGFWSPGQLRYFNVSISAAIRLVRLLQPVMPAVTANPVGRTLLLSQLSARPWALPGPVALHELRSYAASPSFDAALRALVDGPLQAGAPAGSLPGPVVIGWGRKDRLLPPSQADKAAAAFPDARLVWFERSGHFPHWDEPEATARLVLTATV